MWREEGKNALLCQAGLVPNAGTPISNQGHTNLKVLGRFHAIYIAWLTMVLH